MRNLYVTLSFVMVSGILSAQNQYTKTADKLFNRYEYVDAAKEYLKLAEVLPADADGDGDVDLDDASTFQRSSTGPY